MDNLELSSYVVMGLSMVSISTSDSLFGISAVGKVCLTSCMLLIQLIWQACEDDFSLVPFGNRRTPCYSEYCSGHAWVVGTLFILECVSLIQRLNLRTYWTFQHANFVRGVSHFWICLEVFLNESVLVVMQLLTLSNAPQPK